MIHVILCGGTGTRLWPLSRKLYPKQFVKLLKNHSLFQDTIERNKNIFNAICIVTNKDQYFIAEQQLSELNYHGHVSYILEPFGKNTAPAICFACLACNEDDVVIVTPSDHMISDVKAYTEKVRVAVEMAKKHKLVTFGIKPTYPETGFGYIEAEREIQENVYAVKSFKEKPDRNTAEKYISMGNFWWNSGIFAFKAGVYLEELKTHSPEIFDSCMEVFNNSKKDGEKGNKLWLDDRTMQMVPSSSIDYAVMEKSQNVCMITADMGWTDVGSFDAMYELVDKDTQGNSKFRNVLYFHSKNNLVLPNDRKIALLGIEGCIIVDTQDAILFAKKGMSQNVKDVVQYFQENPHEGGGITEYHTVVHRPWGTYTVLAEGRGFKVKKIEVYPEKRLSLQKHEHRSEYWVVVQGDAVIQIGDVEYVKKVGESVFIPKGEKHRLTNRGSDSVVIIETQTGNYLEENDIVRIEDDFDRV